MQQQTRYTKLFPALLLAAGLCIGGCSEQGPVPPASATASAAPVPPADVIARVGDQDITFNQINTMLNSTAVVGVSVPALGSPERDTARVVVLDKVISANLLYLDALRQGLDREPAYQQALQGFADGMLGDRYHRRFIAGGIAVTEEEIQAFFENSAKADTEMTDALRTVIEATLRKRKLKQRLATKRAELRQEIRIEVYPDRLAPADDAQADDVVVAKYGEKVLTWGDVKATLLAAGKGAVAMDPLAMEVDAQLDALQALIDKRIIADKAREAGLENDPLYRARFDEFRKTKLVNMHRAGLAQQMAPSEAQLKAYYEANRGRIMQVEMRQIQEVLFETREQAELFKNKIEAGELTMHQVAAAHSIAPGAKEHLGEVGWVAKDRAQPAVNAVIFELAPDEIGGPVESTEGWHLFKVLDVTDARFEDFNDEETRKRARRRYIHDRLDRYVSNLRRHTFDVAVYENNLLRLAQQESQMVSQLAEQARQAGSVTEQRLKEMQEILGR